MEKDSEQLLLRGRLLERVILQSVRINELETRELKRDLKKSLKKKLRERRLQLRCLAELDQLVADVRQQIENQKNQSG